MQKKNFTITIILIAIAICNLINLCNINMAFAERGTIAVDEFQNEVNELCAEIGETAPKVILVRKINSFSKHYYYLIECQPNAYFIYDINTKTFVEFSLITQSPYKNVKGECYYLGPTYYYRGIDEKIVDIRSGCEMSNENIAYLKEKSNSIRENLDTEKALQSSIEISNNASTRYDENNSAVTSIQNSEFFENLTQCGYYEPEGVDGICAYIAAGMIFAYHDFYAGNPYLDSDLYLNTNPVQLSEDLGAGMWFIAELFELPSAATSSHVKQLMQIFEALLEINITHTSKVTPFFSHITIKNLIADDQPVILFGNLTYPTGGKGNHAVVAYKHVPVGSVIYSKTHFGWNSSAGNNFTQVYLRHNIFYNILGSIYSMKIN